MPGSTVYLTARISPKMVLAACGAGTLTRLIVTPSGAPLSEPVGGSPTNRPLPSMTVEVPPRVSASSGEPLNRLTDRAGWAYACSTAGCGVRRTPGGRGWLAVHRLARREGYRQRDGGRNSKAGDPGTQRGRSYGHAAARRSSFYLDLYTFSAGKSRAARSLSQVMHMILLRNSRATFQAHGCLKCWISWNEAEMRSKKTLLAMGHVTRCLEGAAGRLSALSP